MAKKPSKKQRLANKVAEIKSLIEKLAPPRLRRALRNACQAEQNAYNAAVTLAAQKLIAWEDKQAEATAAQSEYNTAFMAAMAAYIVLENCLNPPP